MGGRSANWTGSPQRELTRVHLVGCHRTGSRTDRCTEVVSLCLCKRDKEVTRKWKREKETSGQTGRCGGMVLMEESRKASVG